MHSSHAYTVKALPRVFLQLAALLLLLPLLSLVGCGGNGQPVLSTTPVITAVNTAPFHPCNTITVTGSSFLTTTQASLQIAGGGALPVSINNNTQTSTGTSQTYVLPCNLPAGTYQLVVFNTQLNQDNTTTYSLPSNIINITVTNNQQS